MLVRHTAAAAACGTDSLFPGFKRAATHKQGHTRVKKASSVLLLVGLLNIGSCLLEEAAHPVNRGALLQ